MHVVETDFRHYNSAIERFSSIDLLSELAPNITPYRYGFNNPIYWQDRTGLFESEMEAKSFALRNNLSGFELYKRTDGLWGVDHNSISYVRVGQKLQVAYLIKGEMIFELFKYDGTTGGGGAGSSSGSGGGNIGGSGNLYNGTNGVVSSLQTTLDVIGVFDPTGISDGINAVIYLINGDYGSAAISAISILPFGDLAKGGKYAYKAASVAEQATKVSKEIGKNSISLRTPNKIIHYDLVGATHKGVPTPHVQHSYKNFNPNTGEIFWNKDRHWVRPMTQQDIRTIYNHINRKK
ncbi:polymorphic toxin type 24 domain-containing protein [Capnocytophaga sp. ARDL2]|uniref:polymorphic toxin type 24 domain-containing protein n=1 Tax=Capnocytophaga sp. ARDL2 TaxID=3238809 RepID=UPI003555ECEB